MGIIDPATWMKSPESYGLNLRTEILHEDVTLRPEYVTLVDQLVKDTPLGGDFPYLARIVITAACVNHYMKSAFLLA